jgi:hypothetical protein
MIISIGPENEFEKIQYPFLIKNENNMYNMGLGRNFLFFLLLG